MTFNRTTDEQIKHIWYFYCNLTSILYFSPPGGYDRNTLEALIDKDEEPPPALPPRGIPPRDGTITRPQPTPPLSEQSNSGEGDGERTLVVRKVSNYTNMYRWSSHFRGKVPREGAL